MALDSTTLDRRSLALGILLGFVGVGCMVAATTDPGTSRRYQILSTPGAPSAFTVFDQDTGTVNQWESDQVAVYRFEAQ